MKSGILSFNKGLVLQHIRSVLWISVFFLLSQLVLLPLGIMVVLNNDWSLREMVEKNPDNLLFSLSFSIQYLSCMVFPVLTGIILTSYLTKKSSSDFMHSLPFKRSTLLAHVYAAGAGALIVPVLINAVILLLIRPVVKPLAYTAGNVAEWAGVSIFLVLFMFFITVLIGLLIGPAILQGVMAYGILIIPSGLVLLILQNASYFINGLAVEPYASKIIEKGTFLFRAASYEVNPFSGTEWAGYAGIAAAAVALSFWVYKIRPAEAVDETIVFPLLRWVFIFMLTLAAMLIGGMYFAEFLGGASSWMMAGYIVGAFAGYTLLQMIVQKSLRLIWPWKGFVLYAGMVLILLVPGSILAKTYEQALPEKESIEKVYVGDIPGPFSHTFYMEEQHLLKKPDAGFMSGADTIEQVRSLHKALMKMDKGALNEGFQVTISYFLKDGSRMQRQYVVSEEKLAKVTKELRGNAEFIKASNPLFALSNPEKIKFLTVFSSTTQMQTANVADKQAIDAIRKAIEKDALSGKASMFGAYYSDTIGSIDFWIGEENGLTISVSVHLSDEHTIQAIRQYVPNSGDFASVENVSKAFIVNVNSEEEKQQLHDFFRKVEGRELDWSGFPLEKEEVKSRAEIEKLLKPAGLTEESSRMLVLTWKNTIEHGGFTVTGLKE